MPVGVTMCASVCSDPHWPRSQGYVWTSHLWHQKLPSWSLYDMPTRLCLRRKAMQAYASPSRHWELLIWWTFSFIFVWIWYSLMVSKINRAQVGLVDSNQKELVNDGQWWFMLVDHGYLCGSALSWIISRWRLTMAELPSTSIKVEVVWFIGSEAKGW